MFNIGKIFFNHSILLYNLDERIIYMVSSKSKKVAALAVSLFVISGIVCLGFNQLNKNINSADILNQQAGNTIQEEDVKKDTVKAEDLNAVQKYYNENLEQDEIKFLTNAKTSKNNDLEFSKLQTKFIM